MKNLFDLKDLVVEFCEQDNIICVVDEREELPWDGNSFMRVVDRLFFDSYAYKGLLRGNGKTECLCERYDTPLYIVLKGKSRKDKVACNGQDMVGWIDSAEEACYYPSDTSTQMKRAIDLDFREVLYPSGLRDFSYFRGGTCNALAELIGGVDNEWTEMGWLSPEEWEKLKAKKGEFIDNFENLVLAENKILWLNCEGELILQDGYSVMMDNMCNNLLHYYLRTTT